MRTPPPWEPPSEASEAEHLAFVSLREVVDGRVGEDPPDEWRPIGVGVRRE